MHPSALPAPVPVVCAIIERDGLILLAQRPEGKRLAGLWEFPGGKVEPGEDPSSALHRELAEELGCRVTVTRTGPPLPYQYEWGTIILHPFLCQLAAGYCGPTAHEHANLIWVPPEQLGDYALAPADVPVVDWLVKFC